MSLVVVEFRDKQTGKLPDLKKVVEVYRRLRNYKPHYSNIYSYPTDDCLKLAIQSSYKIGGRFVTIDLHKDIISERISDLDVDFKVIENYNLVKKSLINFIKQGKKTRK